MTLANNQSVTDSLAAKQWHEKAAGKWVTICPPDLAELQPKLRDRGQGLGAAGQHASGAKRCHGEIQYDEAGLGLGRTIEHYMSIKVINHMAPHQFIDIHDLVIQKKGIIFFPRFVLTVLTSSKE